MFQFWFSAVHYLKISEQRWFSSEQHWKEKLSELRISAEQRYFSADYLWHSADSELKSSDFWRIQNGNSPFAFRSKILEIQEFYAHYSDFQPNLRKEIDNKTLVVRSFYGPKDLTKKWNFCFLVTAQITELIYFNFSETFSYLVGWNFTIISKNWLFAVTLQTKSWRNLHFP